MAEQDKNILQQLIEGWSRGKASFEELCQVFEPNPRETCVLMTGKPATVSRVR
jgi:hypothetical protein